MRQKITFVLQHLGFGGIERFAITLAEGFIQQGYEVDFLCAYHQKREQKINRQKIHVQYVFDFELLSRKQHKDVGLIKHYLFRNHELAKAISQLSTDIIISTRSEYSKLFKYSSAKLKIATEHNGLIGDKYQKRVTRSCANADYLVVPNTELLNYYKKRVACKCVKIPHALHTIPKQTAKLQSSNLISCGRLSAEKGFSDMINVIAIAKTQNHDIKLHIHGDGPEHQNLMRQVKQLNLSENVIFHGFTDEKTIGKAMLNSALYLCTSHSESFGLAPLEAMSYGVPVISFERASGLLEFVNSTNGVLIKKNDIFEFADKITKLLSSPAELKILGTNARSTAQNFSTTKIIEKWLKILS